MSHGTVEIVTFVETLELKTYLLRLNNLLKRTKQDCISMLTLRLFNYSTKAITEEYCSGHKPSDLV